MVRLLNEWNAKVDHLEKIYISYDSSSKVCKTGDIYMIELCHSKYNTEEDIFNYAIVIDRHRKISSDLLRVELKTIEKGMVHNSDINSLRFMRERLCFQTWDESPVLNIA